MLQRLPSRPGSAAARQRRQRERRKAGLVILNPRSPDDAVKAAARRAKHAADVARWRSRCRRKVALFQVEAGEETFDLMVKYAGLREDQLADKGAVNDALGKLLRKSIAALLDADTRRR